MPPIYSYTGLLQTDRAHKSTSWNKESSHPKFNLCNSPLPLPPSQDLMIYTIFSISYFYEIYDVDFQRNEKRKQHRGNGKTCIIHILDSQCSNHWDMTVLVITVHFVSNKTLGASRWKSSLLSWTGKPCFAPASLVITLFYSAHAWLPGL